ncbi:recombinase family protein [Mycobacterium lacus]|uniref:Serine recombinase n=1 Tax=Mycobacterium lacus TaxID=169765 RepID=A0A1X1XUZ2_9MYCO|nr:recombinase family protein [Mycobacterium lacus]MCV7122304.1 recombinase family protein [Mycobacterium lacus]ORW02657.1 serine recombinase [Mycobacterium lacus]BBX97038.1 serine recombinase [Mycobacterium lacus]
MKAALYLRQSLDRDGTELAVARQRKDCLALCAQRGWDPVEYVDNDKSATNGKPRPAYQRMLADIAEDRVGAIVAWHTDRLYRQPRDLEDLIDLADEHKLALATVSGDIDLSTDMGRLVARLVGATSKGETERKSARQRAAARQKAEHGRPQWRRAFGYLDGPNGPEPDPKAAPLVKQAYAALLAGASTKDLAAIFNDAGAYGLNGKPWSRSTVSLFLRKPRNAGLREYNGEVVGRGKWTPLVDESTWRAAQSVLNAPGRAPGRKTVRQHLLTGVLRCGCEGCGSTLSGRWAMQKTGGKPGRPRAGETRAPKQVSHSIVYVCKSCRGVSIREDHVKPLVYGMVAERLARPDAAGLLRAEVHDEANAEALRVEANALLARLDEIAVERAEGELTGKQAKIATDIINAKLDAIEAKQQDQERMRLFDGLPLGRPGMTKEMAEKARAQADAAVRALSPDRFRAVLNVLAEFTVMPVGKGHRPDDGERFDPKRVKEKWR